MRFIDVRAVGTAIVLAVIIAGCGAAPPDVAEQPPGEPAAQERGAGFDGELLSGVPGCRLVEAIGADDDPTPDDEALGERVVAAIDHATERGPLVGVDATDDSERTFVAARILDRLEDEPDVAVWVVEEGGDPPMVAVNDMAASVSDLPPGPGGDPMTGGGDLAYDCAWVAADRLHPRPPDPPPTMRPDLLVLDPERAAAGDTVEMRFPEETMRGVAFHLDRRVGDGWQTTHWLTSDGGGGEPVSVPAGTEGFGWPDIGVTGPGPDRIEIPADAPVGEHRICTANAGDDFCAPVEIVGG